MSTPKHNAKVDESAEKSGDFAKPSFVRSPIEYRRSLGLAT